MRWLRRRDKLPERLRSEWGPLFQVAVEQAEARQALLAEGPPKRENYANDRQWDLDCHVWQRWTVEARRHQDREDARRNHNLWRSEFEPEYDARRAEAWFGPKKP